MSYIYARARVSVLNIYGVIFFAQTRRTIARIIEKAREFRCRPGTTQQ